MTRLDASIHFRFEEAIGPAAVHLSSVHCQIGVFEKLIGIRAIGGSDGEADAGTYVQLLTVDLIWLAQALNNAASKGAALFGTAHIGLDYGKLIAAKPSNEVTLFNAVGEPGGHQIQ